MPNFQQVQEQLKGDTGRLAGTYLLIIMALTVIFSGIIYGISSSQFDRPLQPRGGGDMGQFNDYFRTSLQIILEQRAAQARAELLASLVLLNLAVLFGGAFVSYILARKSLEPIEAAMSSQAQFVSDASHELRTPLTALQVTNEVALRKKKLTLSGAKELIGHNLDETIKLRDLTESLLGLARQDNASATQSKVSLSEIVASTVQTLAPLAEQKQITITQNVPQGTVMANELALTQIIRTLLDNALKYSPEGSSVVVKAEQSDKRTHITVSDNGPGIDAEHHAKIFDRFYRVDQSRSSQHAEGNGLGLAIARTIAERNGYELTVESIPGEGATFILSIG